VANNNFTFKQQLRYWFDNTMARGTVALIGWLSIISTLLIVIISVVVMLIAPQKEDGSAYSFTELVWMGLMRTLDAGTMGGDSGSLAFLGAMLATTLGGIFIVSTLIGVLTSGIDSQLESLRKGRSVVVEQDHTVILGWSEHVFTIVSELMIANENRKRPCIVILADRDKVEMDDEIKDKVGATGKTRVVCRTGSPMNMSDLEIVNINGARSIIVLSPEGEDQDSQVIKIILAITNNPNRRKEPYNVVAELHDRKNVEVARMVGGDEVEIIESSDVIARITAQTCRQSGLSIVYTELLDFGGDEIYFQEEPQLVGKTFGDVVMAYESCAIIGLQKKGGPALLNPAMDTVVAPGDKVIAIAEDDDKVVLSQRTTFNINEKAIRSAGARAHKPERTLLLGWNERAPIIINELDNYVSPGSIVTVVADYTNGHEAIERRCAHLKNSTVTFQLGDTTDRETLDELNVASYDQIIVLCYSEMMDTDRADARTLITLLHLRDIESRCNSNFAIVSEMLDVRNRELAQVTSADDFIVSNNLISLLFTQISENKNLNAIFTDIFDADGSEIYLRPAQDYVNLGEAVEFYTVVEAARRRNQIAIGYRLDKDRSDAGKAYGVVVNPNKSRTLTFSDQDQIIVISED
jgi:ion channel POLLUX/CASTOR